MTLKTTEKPKKIAIIALQTFKFALEWFDIRISHIFQSSSIQERNFSTFPLLKKVILTIFARKTANINEILSNVA